MRATMRADGTTYRLGRISDPVETEYLVGMERTADGPHRDDRDEVGVEAMTVSATRGLLKLLLPPAWTVVYE